MSSVGDVSGTGFERVVLITGAGSGIGAALGRRIAALIAFLPRDEGIEVNQAVSVGD
jgi:NAD(P)-dependent dehydrogenase (short-subunit alcohol dehydrogenase family)